MWIKSAHKLAVRASFLSMPTLSQALPPTFTAKTARDLGVHPRELYTWRDAGEITELSRGVFRRADAPASYLDVLAVAYRAPRGIICCLSAAVIHDLPDELPGSVQVSRPQGQPPAGDRLPACHRAQIRYEKLRAGP